MKLGVLHLSDIHFRSDSDPARKYGSCLARASYQFANQCDEFVVVVTGDVAFGGKCHEYEYAKELLSEVADKISAETGLNVNVFVTPGNHDCNLIPEDEIRNITISTIASGQSSALSDAVVNKCTEAQRDYFEFESSIRLIKPVFEDKLWKEFEFVAGGGVVRISVINAAWMSTLNESPGQLVFPVDRYLECLESPSKLRLALIHHPLNWYCQGTYHPMRRALKTHCNAVLSGHEHSVGSEIVSDQKGNTLMIEAAALQPHEVGLNPQFSCLLFDVEGGVVREQRFQATNENPIMLDEEIEHQFYVDEKCSGLNKVHPDFLRLLMDPGGNFTHPARGALSAEEIFVYPQLEESDSEIEKSSVFADQLVAGWEAGKKVLVLADDEGGKTFLLRKYFCDVHEQGGLPLYIKAEDFSSITDADVDRLLDRLAQNQYANYTEFKYAESSNKVVLVDDFDRIRGGVKLQEKLVEILERRFVSVFLSASSRFKLNELLGGDSAASLVDYKSYKIRPFGHLLRNTLIKKWYMLDDVKTMVELDRKVHVAETLVNGLLGKSFIPAKPVYLLIFLQSSEQNEQGVLQNSSFSYYYQYLVTKSLKDAGYKADEFDEIFSYLSQMAWFFKNNSRREFGYAELRVFNDKFSDEYTSVDFDRRLDLLCRAKIMAKDGDCYRFSYSYIYYLFVGKYLSDHLHEPEVVVKVDEYCSRLSVRENANIIMFLTHYTSDPQVVSRIAGILDSCFSDVEPLHLNGDMAGINSLVESAASLVIKELNVVENQEKVKINHDRYEESSEEGDDGLEEVESSSEVSDGESAASIGSAVNLTIKTSEILANIVKNYYGSIRKDRKQQYISSIFDSSLRSLSKLVSEILDKPDRFVAEIERELAERFPKMKESDRTRQAKKFAFQLIGLIVTSFIARTGSLVSSDKTREDVLRTVQQHDSNSYRFIEAASFLAQPGNIPFEALEKLSRKLESNAFGFTILQSLIYFHLHMFHTSDKDKQRLASIAKISIQKTRAIDHRSRNSKADALR